MVQEPLSPLKKGTNHNGLFLFILGTFYYVLLLDQTIAQLAAIQLMLQKHSSLFKVSVL